MCDLHTGVCGPADKDSAASPIEVIDLTNQTKVKLIYYTDPICSSCWAIEPQLRKFKANYGHVLDIEYRMGGLLEKWEGFSDRNNGISKPQDVAHHWDEVGQYSGMSIDGDVWLNDPLSSSYPASIAYYAVYYQNAALAQHYLRRIREMVFLEKVNIAKFENLLRAAAEIGADTAAFNRDFHDSSKAQTLFNQSLTERAMYGVRGFPTFIFIANGKALRMSGSQPYEQYVSALNQAAGSPLFPIIETHTIPALLKKYGKLSTLEVATMLNKPEPEVLKELQQLTTQKQVKHYPAKFGDFWSIN